MRDVVKQKKKRDNNGYIALNALKCSNALKHAAILFYFKHHQKENYNTAKVGNIKEQSVMSSVTYLSTLNHSPCFKEQNKRFDHNYVN